MQNFNQSQLQSFDYSIFSTFKIQQIIGVTIIDQYCYIVQPFKISVYQYHGHQKIPTLIEQHIYNNKIQRYLINKYYFCTYSQNKIQLRNRQLWIQVAYLYQQQKNNPKIKFFLNDHYLNVLQQKQLGQTIFSIIDVKNKISLTRKNIGKQKIESINIMPTFKRHMDVIQNFYILLKNQRQLEYGMFYYNNTNLMEQAFAINQIQTTKFNIKYYKYIQQCKILNHKYLLLIIQDKLSKKLLIKILMLNPIFQCGQEYELNTMKRLNQITNYLSNLSIQRLTQNCNQKDQEIQYSQYIKSFQIQNIQDKIDIIQGQNNIYVIQKQQLIKIIFNQASLQRDTIQKIIQFKRYKLQNNQRFISQYKDALIFSQKTISLVLAKQVQCSQEIEQEIQSQNDKQIIQKQQINNKQKQKHINANILKDEKKSYNSFNVFDQQNYEQIKKQSQFEFINNIYNICIQSQTQLIKPITTCDGSTQTDQYNKNHDEIPQLQNLVAKYSSAFHNACNKIKQNRIQKQKFNQQITLVLNTIANNQIKPMLQQKYLAILQKQITQITAKISYYFQEQIINLNQSMRKLQIKQGHTRGIKLFQYSKSIDSAKQYIASLLQCIKSNQINKFSINQIMLQQAKIIKQKVVGIQGLLIQVANNLQSKQKQIQGQVLQISNLIKKLQQSDSSDQESNEEQEQQEVNDDDEQSDEYNHRYDSLTEGNVKISRMGYQVDYRNLQPKINLDKHIYPPGYIHPQEQFRQSSASFTSNNYPYPHNLPHNYPYPNYTLNRQTYAYSPFIQNYRPNFTHESIPEYRVYPQHNQSFLDMKHHEEQMKNLNLKKNISLQENYPNPQPRIPVNNMRLLNPYMSSHNSIENNSVYPQDYHNAQKYKAEVNKKKSKKNN